jgi:hypothetical protein
MCMDRDDYTGLPNQLIACPAGARYASDSCQKARCEYVFIPLRNPSKQIPSSNSIWINILCIIFLLIFLKYFLVFYSSKIIKK